MSKGSYLVYERSSRDEERLFFDTAKEIVNEIEEPRDWKKRDPKRHPGGRPFTYPFRSMLLILLLMVYHRKEYRENGGSPEQQPTPSEGAGTEEVARQVNDAESVCEDGHRHPGEGE